MSKKNEVELFVDVIVELCPHCGAENTYANAEIGESMVEKCRGCGRWIVLCDRCEDHTRCEECEWCKVAESKNRKEGFETGDGE